MTIKKYVDADDCIVLLDNLYKRLKQIEFPHNKDETCDRLVSQYNFIKMLLPPYGYLDQFKRAVEKGLEINYKAIILVNYRLLLSVEKHIDNLVYEVQKLNSPIKKETRTYAEQYKTDCLGQDLSKEIR